MRVCSRLSWILYFHLAILVYRNQCASRLVGYTPSEVMGHELVKGKFIGVTVYLFVA